MYGRSSYSVSAGGGPIGPGDETRFTRRVGEDIGEEGGGGEEGGMGDAGFLRMEGAG